MFVSRYDFSADIWSFGITLYEVSTGKAPLANMSLTQVILTTVHDEAPVLPNKNGRKYSDVSSCPELLSLTMPEFIRLLLHLRGHAAELYVQIPWLKLKLNSTSLRLRACLVIDHVMLYLHGKSSW